MNATKTEVRLALSNNRGFGWRANGSLAELLLSHPYLGIGLVPTFSQEDIENYLQSDKVVYWESADHPDRDWAWCFHTKFGLVVLLGKMEYGGYEISIDTRESLELYKAAKPDILLMESAYRCLTILVNS
jgi:hypothetical protein